MYITDFRRQSSDYLRTWLPREFAVEGEFDPLSSAPLPGGRAAGGSLLLLHWARVGLSSVMASYQEYPR